MDNSMPDVPSDSSFASVEGPETNEKVSSKKPVALILFVIIAIAVGVTIFLSTRPKESNNDVMPTPTPTETPTPTPDDLTSDWSKYEDDNVPFEIKYPDEVTLVSEQDPNPELGLQIVRTLKISATPVEETLGYDKATAEKDFPKVRLGEFGESIDFPYEESQNVTKVGDIYVKHFLVLSRLEVCSVVFEHFFIFYHNDYQVIAKVVLDSDAAIAVASTYFKTDSANCGTEKIWKDLDEFYTDLEANEVPQKIEDWYDISNLMLETIKAQ